MQCTTLSLSPSLHCLVRWIVENFWELETHFIDFVYFPHFLLNWNLNCKSFRSLLCYYGFGVYYTIYSLWLDFIYYLLAFTCTTLLDIQKEKCLTTKQKNKQTWKQQHRSRHSTENLPDVYLFTLFIPFFLFFRQTESQHNLFSPIKYNALNIVLYIFKV